MLKTGSPCRLCERQGHNAFNCPSKPRASLNTKKPMKRRGSHATKWALTRKKWLKENDATEYECYYCSTVISRDELTLDHKESRARHPELRYVLSNLVPCCAPCNEEKGSLSIEEFLEKRKRDEELCHTKSTSAQEYPGQI